MRDHETKSCPDRGKGPKCYKCNNFGHIAKLCPSAAQDNTAKVNCITRNKTICEIDIRNLKCDALIDSGSELSLMDEKKYREVGGPPLKTTLTSITGAGNAITEVIGTFEENVKINGEWYRLGFFVVPTDTIQYATVLGQDFLNSVEVRLRQGEIIKIVKIPSASQETNGGSSEIGDGKEKKEETDRSKEDACNARKE